MRALVIGVVLALALGFTIKDMSGGSGASPTQAWEERATSFDQSTSLSETGADIREWLIEQMQQAQGTAD